MEKSVHFSFRGLYSWDFNRRSSVYLFFDIFVSKKKKIHHIFQQQLQHL